MSNKQEFIKFAEMAFEAYPSEMPEDAKKYWEVLKVERPEKEKPMFTDNGKLILSWLQTVSEGDKEVSYTSKQIADGIEISSRAVSGAIRKLVTDGFVAKVPEVEPVCYCLTDNGVNVKII